MITFLLMNLIVTLSSFLITFKLLKFNNLIDSLLSLFILYFAQIVITELILGISGVLYLQNVILFNLAILLTFWYITRNKDFYFSFTEINGILRELFSHKLILSITSIILGFGLVKICINLINPPFGWDSLNYHFTFPVEWLKHGNLVNPIVVSCDPSPTYYPINGSLFFLWFILPLKNVFIADLGQIPFFIVAFFSVYSLARKLNLSKEYALFSAALFTLVPNYFKQLEIAYIDVMVTALFLAALNFLFLLFEDGSVKNTVLYSLALGLMMGIKTTALPYAFMLFMPFIYACIAKSNFRKSLFLITISIFLIIFTGGFSFLRNYFQTGNPLFPLELKLLGKTIFPGVIENSVYRTHFLPQDYSLSKILFSEGLGVQTVIFLLPAILLALPITIAKRRKELSFNLVFFLILPFLLALVYRFIIPLANLRYIYSLLGVGFIIAFYVADLSRVPIKILKTLIFICVLASTAEIASHYELIYSIILSFLIFFTLSRLSKIKINKRILSYKFFILVALLCFLSAIVLEKDYIKNEYNRYIKTVDYSGFWPDATKAWGWLNKNTSGNNIAYVGRPVPFPLYGSNFKNNVYYVSVNKTDPVKLNYFPNSRYYWEDDFLSMHKSFEDKGNYRSNANYYVWLGNLSKRNTDYLFIYSLHQTKDIEFPLEDKWAKANPNKFNLAFTNDTAHIYKILR